MKKDIDLIYVTGKKTYNGVIKRDLLIDEMSHVASWFQDCNFNALKLLDLLPIITTVTINDDIISTQDVPFILYTTENSAEQQILKLRRPCNIVWSFIMNFCNQAVEDGVSDVSK